MEPIKCYRSIVITASVFSNRGAIGREANPEFKFKQHHVGIQCITEFFWWRIREVKVFVPAKAVYVCSKLQTVSISKEGPFVDYFYSYKIILAHTSENSLKYAPLYKSRQPSIGSLEALIGKKLECLIRIDTNVWEKCNNFFKVITF